MKGEAIAMFSQARYAMKKHHAKRLHYDLRLEWNGVLLSWALPEGPSCRAGVIREAVEMEDHKSAYLLFEGVHKTGPIMLWDCGTWEPDSEFHDIDNSLVRGVLRFTLRGEKLKGSWTLVRTNIATNTSRLIWTLCKQADPYAESHASECILTKRPNSIKAERSMEEIVQDWTRPKDRNMRQTKLFDEK